ncbi:MAG: OmpA family protein [Terriglobia bacterium]
MGLITEPRKPAAPQASEPRSGAGGKQPWLWGAVALLLAVIATGAILFLRQLRSIERQVAQLNQQAEEAQLTLKRSEQNSQAALLQASQAAASAQQAADQRNQAEQAQSQAEKAAGLARQQAQAAQQQAALAQQKAEQYRQEREAEMNRLQQVLGQIADTRRTAMGLIMTLGSSSIKFDFDKANLRPENREILSRIAGVLMTLKGYHISVFGYTDDVGTQDYNLKLSERRARAVRDYLVKAGLDPAIINTKGFGKSDPRVPGDSPQARAKNRRVEIGIVDSTLNFSATPPAAN